MYHYPRVQYEYAQCWDDTYGSDNAKDHTWFDGNRQAYREVECLNENDGDQSDAVDPVGKPFGWYGGKLYGHNHQDEHGEVISCESGGGLWAPVYCHSWLCLMVWSGREEKQPRIFEPVFHSGETAATAGRTFFDRDNCSWIRQTW